MSPDLEYSANVTPSLDYDYGPYRCHCEPGYRCAACKAEPPRVNEQDHRNWFAERKSLYAEDVGRLLGTRHAGQRKGIARRREELHERCAVWLHAHGRFPLTVDLNSRKGVPHPPGWFSMGLVYYVYPSFAAFYADCVAHAVGTEAQRLAAVTEQARRLDERNRNGGKAVGHQKSGWHTRANRKRAISPREPISC